MCSFLGYLFRLGFMCWDHDHLLPLMLASFPFGHGFSSVGWQTYDNVGDASPFGYLLAGRPQFFLPNVCTLSPWRKRMKWDKC
jgi:hypothetical protein